MSNEQNGTEIPDPGTMEDSQTAFLRFTQEYISVREAAQIMGVSARSVYGYIQRGKLANLRVGTFVRVSATSARTYQRSVVGRPRCYVPIWRTPVARNLQYLLTITVRVRQGQQERLGPRLEEIRASKKHLLPGTVARSIVHDEANPEVVHMVFVWRRLLMPPDAERDAAIAALQADLADILDWETACSSGGRVVMNA